MKKILKRVVRHAILMIAVVCTILWQFVTVKFASDQDLTSLLVSTLPLLNAKDNIMATEAATMATALERPEKKLLIMNALGRPENLPFMVHAKQRHFDDWTCIAFLYVNETKVPENHDNLVQLRKEGCTVIRTPGVHWGIFLQYLPPVLIETFDYVAVLLDDMYLPDSGPTPINIPRLLQHIKQHNITSISPAVMGDPHRILNHPYARGNDKTYATCLTEIKFINTFLQIFTREAWSCYYNMLHYTGGRGWCYDTCLLQHCGGRLAVDYTQVAFHLEKARSDLLAAALANASLVYVPAARQADTGMYDTANLYVTCKRLRCPDIESLKAHVHPIACQTLPT